jgi:GT2 family glycosyltransferase
MPDIANISVVIASINRPMVLEETLLSLKRQTQAPREIIISLVSESDCTEAAKRDPDIKVVYGPPGSTFQRNTGMRAIAPQSEYVLFLDDDMALSRHYLENCANVMEGHRDIVLIAGNVLELDTTRHAAERMIGEFDAVPPAQKLTPVCHANGCNMFARAANAKTVLFDENLPLYALNEDYDWSRRLAARGRIVHASACAVVHLRTTVGRVSDRRFGYSQIANPYYLWRKGSIDHLSRVLKRHWGHAVPMNIFWSVFRSRSGPDRSQRRERLRGNLTAFVDIARGHCTPNRILDL